MEIGKIGVWCSLEAMPAAKAAETAQRIESLGYSALWVPEAVGREIFAQCSFLLASTSKLVVASGIANIYARDAVTMSAGRRTLAEQSAGRFVLGVGVSHRPLVQGIRGHDPSSPLATMRRYLEAMENAPYMSIPATDPSPVVIGALHPRMLALSAEKTDGAHTYLVPPEHTAFARETMGPDAWICAEQKVMLERDATTARGAARNFLAMYLALPNYRRSLERFGYGEADLESGGSDRLVDALVAWGDEKAIRARIDAHLAAGATHVCIQPLDPHGLPVPDLRALEALAPERS